MYYMSDVEDGGPAPMYRGVLLAVTLYDVAEPDPGVETVPIATFEETEIALRRGPGGWAAAWSLLRQWPEEREYAAWPAARRAARATIQARLSTP
jgi:hypothetical protein